VKSGDKVPAGTPLLQIDALKQEATVNSQEAALAAQEANLRYAKISLERAQKLFDAGVIRKQDFDNAQTSYDAARAQVKALDEQVKQQKVELHYYSVTSPMDGIVGDIPVRVGDSVTVSTLLTTVDEPGALEAYIYVPAERAKDLKLGLPVRLLDDAAPNKLGVIPKLSLRANVPAVVRAGRSRDRDCSRPPPQIRTGATNASGSHLG
jgi:RND family efflux transporter MFP subunit